LKKKPKKNKSSFKLLLKSSVGSLREKNNQESDMEQALSEIISYISPEKLMGGSVK
jgi:hypothetical protein